MILGDFHCHSTFSDGKLTIPELVDFYGRRGFGAIAVTDHIREETTLIGKAAGLLGHTLSRATFPLYREILRSEAERAWKLYKMVLLPGFELSKNTVLNSRSAHILGIGLSEYMSADGDALELARDIRSFGGIAVAAHPVSTRKIEKQTYYLWDRREELADEFDAWEVASGPHLFDEVLRSRLPKIASSDLHHPRQIRSWKTIVYSERHPEAVLDAIRRQEVSFHFFEEEDSACLRGAMQHTRRHSF
jgi:predicted metal-dependent phosphoesterase TrpH